LVRIVACACSIAVSLPCIRLSSTCKLADYLCKDSDKDTRAKKCPADRQTDRQTGRQTDRLAEHQQTEGQAQANMQEPDASNFNQQTLSLRQANGDEQYRSLATCVVWKWRWTAPVVLSDGFSLQECLEGVLGKAWASYD